MRRLLAALALAAVACFPAFAGANVAHAKANLTTVSTIGGGGEAAAVVATVHQPLPKFTPVVKIVKTVQKKSSPKPIIIRDLVVEKKIKERNRLAKIAREAEAAKRAEAKQKKVASKTDKSYKTYEAPKQTTKQKSTVKVSGVRGPSSSYNWATPGQCTWGALQKWKQATGWYLGGFHGNAEVWGYRAANAGHRVGTTPRARSVVVMQAGVHGSGSVGHVAWVTNVSGNKVTYVEMNGLAGPYNWSTRTVSHQGGMQYIYAP